MKIRLLILTLLIGTSICHAGGKRIISLASSLTKSIYYLEAQDQLVGRTSYCFVADKDNKEVVASAVTVNIEKVLSLKPDLVIATGITDPETIELIRKAGIKTEIFQTPRNFSEVCSQFRRLASLCGSEKLADSIIKESQKTLDDIKAYYKGKTPRKVFFQIGANPLFAAIENTFMDDYITLAGGTNIAAGLKKGTVNREWVLMKNPDVIIIVNMGLAGDDEMKIWQSYPHLKAAKNNLIFFVESDMASTPNPVDFVETMKVLHRHLSKLP
jgi:ABC-type Fe3+-hydroxamate transport system substrate-binding protein